MEQQSDNHANHVETNPTERNPDDREVVDAEGGNQTDGEEGATEQHQPTNNSEHDQYPNLSWIKQSIKKDIRFTNYSSNGKNPNMSSSAIIHRVHPSLRDGNDHNFTPQLVSIGPYHHGNDKFSEMQSMKLTYLHELISRNSNDDNSNSLDRYINVVRGKAKEASKQYSSNDIDDLEVFAKMLVVDGCFILEILLKCYYGDWKGQGDIVNLKQPLVRSDLLLVENQIPFFILEVLFEEYKKQRDEAKKKKDEEKKKQEEDETPKEEDGHPKKKDEPHKEEDEPSETIEALFLFCFLGDKFYAEVAAEEAKKSAAKKMKRSVEDVKFHHLLHLYHSSLDLDLTASLEPRFKKLMQKKKLSLTDYAFAAVLLLLVIFVEGTRKLASYIHNWKVLKSLGRALRAALEALGSALRAVVSSLPVTWGWIKKIIQILKYVLLFVVLPLILIMFVPILIVFLPILIPVLLIVLLVLLIFSGIVSLILSSFVKIVIGGGDSHSALGRIPNARRLRETGFKFRKKEASMCFLNLSNKGRTILIPKFPFEETTTILFKNLIAFEQSSPEEYRLSFTAFAIFMDYLIDTEQDVALLRKCGIIDNRLGKDEEVADFFNNLHKGIYIKDEKIFMFNEVQDYYRNHSHMVKFYEWRSQLIPDYFHNWRAVLLVIVLVWGVLHYSVEFLNFLPLLSSRS